MELVPLKYGKLVTKYPWIYRYFYSVICAKLLGIGVKGVAPLLPRNLVLVQKGSFIRSFVLSGVAVDCWQSFDVPSSTSGCLFIQQPPKKGTGSRGSFKLLHQCR